VGLVLREKAFGNSPSESARAWDKTRNPALHPQSAEEARGGKSVSAFFHKRGMALHPSDEAALKGLMRMGDGECVLVSVVRPRCANELRRYYAICQSIAENQDPPRDKDSIDHELRIRSGHYDVLLIEGHEIRTPKRIAFDKMSQEQWISYWERVEACVAQHFGVEYLLNERAA
jgi:hypothetical protein